MKRGWTKEEALAALRSWIREHGGIPRSEDWTAGAGRPGRMTLVRLFGSWREALIAAGVDDPPGRRWTRCEALESLCKWMAVHGQPVFNDWCPAPPGCPSRSTLQLLFGSWSAAMQAAGGTPLGRGERVGPAPDAWRQAVEDVSRLGLRDDEPFDDGAALGDLPPDDRRFWDEVERRAVELGGAAAGPC